MRGGTVPTTLGEVPVDEWLSGVVLGLVQALTEFLPVSSSGHLLITHELLGDGRRPLAFDVGLHVGTLAAVLLYFRTYWERMLREALADTAAGRWTPDRWATGTRLLAWVLLGTLPAVAAGFLWADVVEEQLRSPLVVATTLATVGVLLWAGDRYAPRRRSSEDLAWWNALLIGIAQATALVPGVSRSGSTILAGRLLSLDRGSAARFSFLLSAPVIAGAAAFEIPSAIADGEAVAWGPLAVGTLVAFMAGLLVIRGLLGFVERRSFAVFAWYRIGLAAAIVLAVAQGWL